MGILDAPATIPSVKSLSTQLGRGKLLKIIGRNYGINFNKLNVGTDFSGTSRLQYKTCGPISFIQAYLGQGLYNAGEGNNVSVPSGISQLTVEYNSTIFSIQKSGSNDILMPFSKYGSGTFTDMIGVTIPAQTNFFTRLFTRIPKFPSSPSATATAGGVLVNGTTYYYYLTTVDNGVESSFSTEVSATASGANLSVSLAWTAPLYGQYVNIYRSTSTTTEKFLTQVPIQQVTFIDNGTLTPNSLVSPPAAITYSAGRYTMYAAEGGTVQYGGGGGQNCVFITGTGNYGGSGFTGINGIFVPTPAFLLGDDTRNPSIMGLGDSIMAGTGLNTLQGTYSAYLGNWFDRGFSDGQFAGTLNWGIASSQVTLTVNGNINELALGRFQALQYADYVVSNWGHNDLAASVTWQATAAAHLQLANTVWNQGGRFIICTLLPTNTSTNNWSTIGGQSQATGTVETARLNYNAWIRNGCQVDGSGAPVLSGGTVSPYIYSYFDFCLTLEVNSSNAPTINGGYLLAPSAATYTGQVLTGTPTATAFTVGAAAYPIVTAGASNGLVGKTVVMTSGAASGQSASIKSNTATTMVLYANGANGLGGIPVTGLTIVPAASDTFSIYEPTTVDGVHPSSIGHSTLGTAFATWVAANIIKFGSMIGN